MKKLLTILLLAGIAIILLIPENEAVSTAQNAKAAIILNASTDKIIYESNANEALPIASLSKLMTQYIVLDAIAAGSISWDSLYKPSTEVLNQPSRAVKLDMQSDKTYTVKELFTAMTVISANDATVALAEMVSGSEEKFAAKMNNYAKKIGLSKTHFINATGLDGDETNLATARDIAAIANVLIDEHSEVLQFTSMTDFTTSSGVKRWSTNLMLPGMPEALTGMDGLKTGYTELAESCFASTGIYDGDRIITVVIGVAAEGNDTIKPRFDLTRELIDSYVLNQQ
ncbi:D-alanyl-D-alanine carboxypeptidase [Sporosarcina sp. Sa2YVA2]|uniref:D-alanyl-D-alanine carboxypeptidase n=1 Tax=Sporosarcina quadrami TaxID=2762234 RepID=A0ABR8U7K1_9BACL|nr:D-alanyl-D-alanine carboxypeptidase family protein [Sporosarcina quadrami]MBD7984009.1 D-alanyl-D-alanine carboxypeptidase [Sporosarcina quadrami]